MGSFNTTCFVSQQTISTNDEVIVFPISQQTTSNPVELVVHSRNEDKKVSKYGYTSSTCHSTAFWAYDGPMLKGKYDDYGRIEFQDTKENKEMLLSFLKYLSTKVCDVKLGENTSHDLAMVYSDIFNPKEKYSFDELIEIMDKVWEMSDESRLFVTNYNGEPVSMAFSVMHACAGDYLVEEVSKQKSWDGCSLESKNYFHFYVNKKLAQTLEIFTGKKEKKDIVSFFAVNVSSLEGFRIGEKEGAFIGKHYDLSNFIMDKLIDYFKTNGSATTVSKDLTNELFEVFKTQIEHRYIVEGLDAINVKLTPMVYATQDYDNTLGNDYLKMVKTINKQVNKIVQARYGDDDDFEEEPVSKPKM